jgi:two-component system, OmpR family, phosphate regulon sensor histidine kinase PhoR
LTLSQLESGPHSGPQTTIDMRALLATLASDAEQLSGGKHRIRFELFSNDGLLGTENEIHSAFGNLVTNAVRYTPAGGEVELSWAIDNGQGTFSVRDTGPGIPAEHIPRLTERFYRVDRGRSREMGGTGLGLAIVKHVLNRHEAKLTIESEIGRGSSFSAVFPAQRIISVKKEAAVALK